MGKLTGNLQKERERKGGGGDGQVGRAKLYQLLTLAHPDTVHPADNGHRSETGLEQPAGRVRRQKCQSAETQRHQHLGQRGEQQNPAPIGDAAERWAAERKEGEGGGTRRDQRRIIAGRAHDEFGHQGEQTRQGHRKPGPFHVKFEGLRRR